MPNQSPFRRGAQVFATFAVPAHLSVPSVLQRASCSLGTTSPTSATFRATSCAATGGASRAPGSATGCPTASTRATRRSAVSAGPRRAGRGCWGSGGGPIRHTLHTLLVTCGRWGTLASSPALSTRSSSSEECGRCRNRGLGGDRATALGEQSTPPPGSPNPHSVALSLPSLCTRGI